MIWSYRIIGCDRSLQIFTRHRRQKPIPFCYICNQHLISTMTNKTGTERRPALLFQCSNLPISPPRCVPFKKKKVIRTPPKFVTTHLKIMKGLFKPKIRSPVELVRYAQELLLFIDRNEEVREQKRAEKVLFMFLFMLFFFYIFIWVTLFSLYACRFLRYLPLGFFIIPSLKARELGIVLAILFVDCCYCSYKS